jgi:hypothetical protein
VTRKGVVRPVDYWGRSVNGFTNFCSRVVTRCVDIFLDVEWSVTGFVVTDQLIFRSVSVFNVIGVVSNKNKHCTIKVFVLVYLMALVVGRTRMC